MEARGKGWVQFKIKRVGVVLVEMNFDENLDSCDRISQEIYKERAFQVEQSLQRS